MSISLKSHVNSLGREGKALPPTPWNFSEREICSSEKKFLSFQHLLFLKIFGAKIENFQNLA
jgi:hypothetical protein